MSRIDDLNTRPPTHILSTRLDIRHLATLIRFWHSQNELPRSSSELVRLSIETFVELLVHNHHIDMVELISDAEEILARTGFNTKVISKNRVTALINENFSLETPSRQIDASHQRTKTEKPISSYDIKTAENLLESNLQQDLEKRIKDEQARTEEFKRQISNPDPSDGQGNS